MDACRNERLLQQGIHVPENISRSIPDWFFPTSTSSSARHQSCPDSVFVRSIPGRPSHIDPAKIPPQDRDIHRVEFKFCLDTDPFQNSHSRSSHYLAYHHFNQAQKPQLEKPEHEQQGTIYNNYTIKPLINLGLTRQKAKPLASKGLLGVGSLGAWQWRAAEGESGHPGAWWITLRIPNSFVLAFFLG
eukprot:1149361-Pelagomonas_calceolata.AAC.2